MKTVQRKQQTIAREAGVRGVGFVTEADVQLRFKPAEPDTGIVFQRVDLPGAPTVPAQVRYVVERPRRTSLQRDEAVVEMVEHVMAALAGLQIDNCVVEVDTAETPGCDGSSRAFVEALNEAGQVEQDRLREALVIDRPITIRDGQAILTAYPNDTENLALSYNLDFGERSPISRQSRFVELTPEQFRDEIADSRTFLLEPEARALREAGLGKKISESDLLVIGPDGPINNTLRYPDECVRHKLLDMIGDLALAGHDLIGHVVAHRSGHQHNAQLVREILRRAQAGPQEPKPLARTCDPSAIDIGAIMAMLPHRFPFLLVDRVLEVEPDRRLVAIKNVTINEPFFQGHWPGRPVMPGVLILEALAQTCGLLIAQRFSSAQYDAVIASIDGARIRRPVVPGDQLRMEAQVRRLSVRLSELQAQAFVDGQLATEARIRFVLIEKRRSGAA